MGKRKPPDQLNPLYRRRLELQNLPPKVKPPPSESYKRRLELANGAPRRKPGRSKKPPDELNPTYRRRLELAADPSSVRRRGHAGTDTTRVPSCYYNSGCITLVDNITGRTLEYMVIDGTWYHRSHNPRVSKLPPHWVAGNYYVKI